LGGHRVWALAVTPASANQETIEALIGGRSWEDLAAIRGVEAHEDMITYELVSCPTRNTLWLARVSWPFGLGAEEKATRWLKELQDDDQRSLERLADGGWLTL
jgi:hypothetical protein